jgi:hypothetical protein
LNTLSLSLSIQSGIGSVMYSAPLYDTLTGLPSLLGVPKQKVWRGVDLGFPNFSYVTYDKKLIKLKKYK